MLFQCKEIEVFNNPAFKSEESFDYISLGPR